jgi:hypothetical protein
VDVSERQVFASAGHDTVTVMFDLDPAHERVGVLRGASHVGVQPRAQVQAESGAEEPCARR